jgi:hypothetical protein
MSLLCILLSIWSYRANAPEALETGFISFG